MPEHRPDKPGTNGGLFDRLLLEGTEAELQEFIESATQLFSTQPLGLLSECKACVDARLAAEPNNRVRSFSDPHEVRLYYWRKIADRLQAEINFRSIRSAQNPPGRLDENPVRPGAKKEHAVAARRIIVRQSVGIPDKELCQILDREDIRPPKGWPEAGFKTWTDAWPTRRRRIRVIFSKDRNES